METHSRGRGSRKANVKADNVMMEGGPEGADFDHLILSWSLDDILNNVLYEDKVKNIPLKFESCQHYYGSFVEPLLENTRAELASSMENMHTAPRAEVLSSSKSSSGYEGLVDVTVGYWKNIYGARGKEPYRTLPGDVLILMEGNLKSVSDLKCTPSWCIAIVKESSQEHGGICKFTAQYSQHLQFEEEPYAIYLMSITTPKRIWKSVKMGTNLKVIEKVLYNNNMGKENCNLCVLDWDDRYTDKQVFDDLNKSQQEAIRASLCKTECSHKPYVDLIWGPPGTGKTKTVGVLLFSLLKMNCRTLLCAPTNFAIRQVTSCLFNLVKCSFQVSIGDVVLYGNRERLGVGADIEEVYLEHRVERLSESLGPNTGWKYWITHMTALIEHPTREYQLFLEDENQEKSIEDFWLERFAFSEKRLRECIYSLNIHLPRGIIEKEILQNMISNLEIVSSFGSLLRTTSNVEISSSFESLLRTSKVSEEGLLKDDPLLALGKLQQSLEGLHLPKLSDNQAIKNFCLKRASLIICTASHSFMLHSVENIHIDFLVIDEAAQLKEAESTIPLQLPGIKHVILVGDECQLSAMVTSKISAECEFGRSLFCRLSFLNHHKNLLNVQYRMHPSISIFPNLKFYKNQIMDAEHVKSKAYQKKYLPGIMFGPYSFINVTDGREEKDDDGRSRINMVEVAVVVTIVKMLYQEWNKQSSNNQLTIGVVSPYAAQVLNIQERLANYEKRGGFSLKVKTVDAFQGGEADIIILSTVESNYRGSVGFLSSPQRTNTALTRARHCLWIVGNQRALENNGSVWKELVNDARSRGCLFDAAADIFLKKAIVAVKKDLQQYEDLVSGNSVLFKNEKWKVVFSDDFRRSFKSLNSDRLKQRVLVCLSKLSEGWRPKNTGVTSLCENSSQVLEQYKVEGLYVICTTDIIKESKCYIQVLKVWDMLPLEEIPRLKSKLEKVFAAYTENFNYLCATKCLEGNLEVPMSWPESEEIIRFPDLSNPQDEGEGSSNASDITYVENTKVSESLLLMKFYPLSNGVANHLLSDQQFNLPVQLTNEQHDIVFFPKTSFIIGRSGTGKTTVLVSKLLRNEERYHDVSKGINDSDDGTSALLRQLFVTVSPKLCAAVKRYYSHVTSISRNGNSSVDEHATADVLSSFLDIPKECYPLIITFDKFLTMLDCSLGNSFFERFNRKEKEVTFNRFCSHYWKQFDSRLTKNFDPSRVFTEIISYIKGGITCVGNLSLAEYKSLAKRRSSSLTETEREKVYNIFEIYEKVKSEVGEFDLADLVNDIHHRLESERYLGDHMEYIYIDEVQDMSMRQISLFKHISCNVEEGFVFAGDTAQTIAKGIDFRFEDIRSLFYREFLSKSGKGSLSNIFQLKENLRTHGGVLKLAQSVIDILQHFFPFSIDILDPERSFVFGDAPVLLQVGNDGENAIVRIFGNSENTEQKTGFGAEQVILVRDETLKEEVYKVVEKKALVLTTLECKGLEFRDVLLYKFFGTSALKEKWRVIYGFMKEKNWLDKKVASCSFQKFTVANHTRLCAELKELYVAITRTKQRLWICEEREDLSKSKPMFDYWEKMGLARIIQLDDSMVKAMQVKSSREEWFARGKELFYNGNYLMATLCFEKAKYKEWEARARAHGLRAAAHEAKEENPKKFMSNLKEAVKMFESIGDTDLVDSCSSDLVEYERAGIQKTNKAAATTECTSYAIEAGNSDPTTVAPAECSGSTIEAGNPDPTAAECSGSSNALVNWDVLQEIKEAIIDNEGVLPCMLPAASNIKEELDKIIKVVQTHVEVKGYAFEYDEALEDLITLSSLFTRDDASSIVEDTKLLDCGPPLECVERLQTVKLSIEATLQEHAILEDPDIHKNWCSERQRSAIKRVHAQFKKK